MSRPSNRALHRLLEADYEVSISMSHAADADAFQLRASHADFKTRYASGATLGRAMEELLRKTGLNAP